MPGWPTVLLLVAAAYVAAVLTLALAGRRADAAAVARFISDCLVLFSRLARDRRLSRRRRLLLWATLAYLLTPVDLVPDFIPVAGQLDDAIIVALVLRAVLRSAGRDLLAEHWPGPERTLALLERAAAA